MIPTRSNLTKAVALVLLISLSQIFVRTGAAQGTASQILGRLYTSGDRDILVDKEKANSGMTILDGATLETPDCTTAIVRIGPLDEVHLASNTIAVINYSAGRIKVTLKQGCVRLFTGQGSNGTVETPDGKITPASQLDPSNRQRTEVCYPDGSKSDFSPTCKVVGGIAWPWILGGIGGAGTVLAIVAVAASSSAGDNPSATAPF